MAEAFGRIVELEGGKAKLSSRVTEAEEHIEALNAKIGSAEKSKVSMLFYFYILLCSSKVCSMFLNRQMRMDAELEDMAMEYERTHAAAIITEKRGKNFDKVCFLS